MKVICRRILLTGATGFVGRCLTQALLREGFEVRCLVRAGSEHRLASDAVEVATGDITDPGSLHSAVEGCDAVVNLVGIIREDVKRNITFRNLHCIGTRNCVDAAVSQGVQRFLQMSALGTRENAASRYHQSKYWAEEYVRASSLTHTIFRPSIIFGAEDKSLNYFASMLHRHPFFPVFGDGEYRLAPVSVKTVAEAFAKSVNNPETFNQTYELQGPRVYTYNELLETIAGILHRKPRLLHVPLSLARPVIRLLQHSDSAPITLEQLDMLLEGSTTTDNRLYEVLGLRQRYFEEEAAEYLHTNTLA